MPGERTSSISVSLPEELTKHYEDKKKELGSGGFAKVILAEHIATKEKVAIKIMDKALLAKKDDLHRAYNEIYALKHLIHQHICQLYQVYETEESIFLVIEYCPGGELFDYIVSRKRLQEKEARHLFRQIISAVAYVHKKGYAHRDLKPENMLLDGEKNLKIIDFGLCAKPEHGLRSPLHTRAGSALYASPELISGQPYYGNETDVWSLGVVLYALLCGFLPFDHENTSELYKKIKKGQFPVPHWLSAKSLGLLKEMLQIHADKRIQVKNILQHPWLVTPYEEPVSWESTFQPDRLNQTAINLLSDYYSWPEDETMEKVMDLKYDHVTAFYFLLCKMSDQSLRRFRNTWFRRSKFLEEKLLKNSLLVTSDKYKLNGYIKEGSPVQQRSYRKLPDAGHQNGITKERSNTVDILKIDHQNNTLKNFEKETNAMKTAYVKPTSRARLRSKTCGEVEESEQNGVKDVKENKVRAHTLIQHSDPLVKVTQEKIGSTFVIPNVYCEDVDEPAFSSPSSVGGKNGGYSREVKNNLNTTKRLAASCIEGLNQPTRSVDARRNIDQQKSRSLEAEATFLRDSRPRTKSMKERLSGLFKQEIKPRRVKAIYHVENTSTLSPEAVRKELERVLALLVSTDVIVAFTNPKKYLFKCKAGLDDFKTRFELEICLIPFMDNVVGIRRKRIEGDAWRYKELVEHVLSVARI